MSSLLAFRVLLTSWQTELRLTPQSAHRKSDDVQIFANSIQTIDPTSRQNRGDHGVLFPDKRTP